MQDGIDKKPLQGESTLRPYRISYPQNNDGWLGLERLAAVTSENPARIFGLYPKKGALRVGSDADLVIVDMDREVTIRNEDQITACGWTPYDGYKVKGAPILSVLRGRVIMEDGEVVGEKGYGEYNPRL